MESVHDSFHARHPVLLQVQEERDILEAHDGRVCNGSGVPGRGLDPSEEHDLRNPNQASGYVPFHPHSPVEADPLHTVALPRKPGAHRVQRGDQAYGGENRKGRVQGAGRVPCSRKAALHKDQLPPLGLLCHQRKIGGPKSLRQPSLYVQGEEAPKPKPRVRGYDRSKPSVGQS